MISNDLVVENVIASAQCKLARAEFKHGDSSLDLVAMLGNLASMYIILESYPLAEAAFKRMLKIQRIALGSTHPEIAGTLLALGDVFEKTLNWGEAERCYEAAISILEQEGSIANSYVMGVVLLSLRRIYEKQDANEMTSSLVKREALQWRAAYSSSNSVSKHSTARIHLSVLSEDVQI